MPSAGTGQPHDAHLAMSPVILPAASISAARVTTSPLIFFHRSLTEIAMNQRDPWGSPKEALLKDDDSPLKLAQRSQSSISYWVFNPFTRIKADNADLVCCSLSFWAALYGDKAYRRQDAVVIVAFINQTCGLFKNWYWDCLTRLAICRTAWLDSNYGLWWNHRLLSSPNDLSIFKSASLQPSSYWWSRKYFAFTVIFGYNILVLSK